MPRPTKFIYLQLSDYPNITWSPHQLNDDDIKYIQVSPRVDVLLTKLYAKRDSIENDIQRSS